MESSKRVNKSVMERYRDAHIPEYIGLGGAGMLTGNMVLAACSNPNNKHWLGAIGDGVWTGGKWTLFEALCMAPAGLFAVWAMGAEAPAEAAGEDAKLPPSAEAPPTEGYV